MIKIVFNFKKIACNTCIRIDTFKIKYNFYHKNINN